VLITYIFFKRNDISGKPWRFEETYGKDISDMFKYAV